jgi:hypothetical protein
MNGSINLMNVNLALNIMEKDNGSDILENGINIKIVSKYLI